MAFAAPAARAVAGKATGRAAVRTGAKATGAKAIGAKATTATGRGRQLLAEGKPRDDVARIIRDEFGSSLSEARSVLPPTEPKPPAEPDRPGDGPSPSGRSAPRASSGAGATVGGFILGTLAWVVGLTFLRSGPEGVLVLLRAKFLNQTAVSPGARGKSAFGADGRAGGGAGGGGGGTQ